MSWTKQRPTKPGYYWWRIDAETPEPQIVEISTKEVLEPGCWQVRFRHSENILGLVHGEWQGPLKPRGLTGSRDD
jgi:hypothetical protein